MMGVFWKELRENLKWAAVICGVLSVFIYYELRRAGPSFLYDLSGGTLIFMSPLCGLAMGVVQSWFETKVDNWAFVVHRPVPRWGVFTAKSAAGLALLYAGLGLPCLLAAAWAARPGNIAIPFQGRMVLPLVADVLLSGCYYFAGIVLTLRRARWFGTRLLPIGLALGCSVVMTQIVPGFWQAVLLVLAVQGVGALASWNVFASGGAADRNGASRIGLGVMIYAGALPVGLFLVGLPNAFYQTTPQWTTYQMDKQGEVVRVQWSMDIESRSRNATVTDIAGKPLPEYDGVDLDDPSNADRFMRFNNWLAHEDSMAWPLAMFYTGRGFHNMSSGVIRLRAVAAPNARLRVACLYNVPRQLIELYDPASRLLLGTVGPAGYANAQSAPADRFPGTPVNPAQQGGTHALAFPSVVYWMELDQRRVRPIFQTTADDPVFAAMDLGPQNNPMAVIATRHGLHLLRPSGEAVCTIDLELDPEKYYFQMAILPTNQHPVLYAGSLPGIDHKYWRDEYLEFGTDGALIRRTEFPRSKYPGGPKMYETAALGVVYPLWALPVLPPWLVDFVIDLRTEQYAGMFHGLVYGSSVMCVLATILLGRRYGFGVAKTVAWALGNGLLGPGGILVMIGLNEMPAKEPCAACGRKRLTGRQKCSACGAGLEPPVFDGREIFEPGEALQPVLM